MNVSDQPRRPTLSPREGRLSAGRQVPLGRPMRHDRWSQSLEVIFKEEMPGGEAPLLQAPPSAQRLKGRELTREQVTARTFAAVMDPTKGPEVRDVLAQLLAVLDETSSDGVI